MISKGMEGFCGYRPRWTESNLSPANKVANEADPTSEGAGPTVHMLNGERDAETGKLLTYDGRFSW